MENIDIMKEYYEAICHDRIKAYYQPVFYLDRNPRVISAEALCRLELKDGTILTPDHFIPGLERTGEICTLDWIMIDKACSMALKINAETRSEIVISVNFSACHVNEWDAVDRLCSIVDSYYLDHDQIEIEITETYKADDFLLTFMMKRLRGEGFHVAVDDFAEGYNSLKLIKTVRNPAVQNPDLNFRIQRPHFFKGFR